ncbi:MAG: SusC/RagA family TonB-linked outer membrane protein [Gemmatimonadaceae bacterium]
MHRPCLSLMRSVSAAGAALVISSAPLIAQTTGTIRGRVTDASGDRGIPSATVMVPSRQQSAITSATGDYVIANVAAGTVDVAVRRIGYARATRTITVTAGAETRVDFSLSVVSAMLDAVVVTGTGGAAEKRTLGNSITQLDVGSLNAKTSMVNVTEVLQGKSPGVTILPGSGVTGTAGEIRIRGASSLSGYKPVVFIDGIRFNIDDLGGFSATGGGTAGLAQSSQVTSALNNLNPNDIESIEIIKGPAAATLYGAEAANGVIQIITKKGVRGPQSMRWGFKAETGQSAWKLLPQDNLKTCDAATQAAVVSPVDTTHVWPVCLTVPVNTVIRDNPLTRDTLAIRDGNILRYSGNVRGGGERYSFYMAADRDVEQGVFYNSDNNRTSIRSNFGFNPSEKSNFEFTVNWQDGRLRLPIQDESANGLLLSAVRGDAGRISRLGAGNEGWKTISPRTANRYQNYTESERLTLGATVTYNPLKWFQNRMTAGFDNSLTQAQLLFLPGDIEATQDADAATGANFRSTPTRRILTLDYAGTLLWNVRSNLLATTLFGTQVVADNSKSVQARGIGIGAIDVTRVDLLTRTTGLEGFSENNSVGYYVQEQFALNNRLFLTGALRADDHSSFGTNFDLIIYPKVSASYVLSEEPGAKGFLDASRINTLKLRTAWGQAGRAPSAYSAPQTYTVDRVTQGTATNPALRTSSIGNPDLKPERGTELEVGFDLGMFQDRLGAEFTFYNKTTDDMLQSILVPASTGFNSSRLGNLGSVLNRGIELSVFGSPVRLRQFEWETRVNLSTNHNELTGFGVESKTTDTPTGQAYGVVQQHRVGYPLGGYWVTPPSRNANGAALLTPAGAAIYNTGDSSRRYIGPSVPTREMGFSNTMTFFKRFSVYALLDYKSGAFLFNQQERSRCQAANDNCTRVNDPRARFPQSAADSVLFKELAVYRNTSGVSPEWIQSSDFVKLRELSLSIDVPERLVARAGASSAKLTLSGRNLKVWSKYEGVDPEVNSYGGRNFVRVDAYAAPMMRRLTAALTLGF